MGNGNNYRRAVMVVHVGVTFSTTQRGHFKQRSWWSVEFTVKSMHVFNSENEISDILPLNRCCNCNILSLSTRASLIPIQYCTCV
jgi:hypothetical protein